MSPSTDGVMKLAPNPTRKRPPQVNTSIDVAVTTTASPRMASAKPMRSVLRQPTTTPIMPPAIMHEPATSEYARFAICTSDGGAKRTDQFLHGNAQRSVVTRRSNLSENDDDERNHGKRRGAAPFPRRLVLIVASHIGYPLAVRRPSDA